MKSENWRPVPPEFALGYQVSDLGRIRDSDLNILSYTNSSKSPSGKQYKMVMLGGKYFKVHRIVATVFVPNPNGFKDVSFIRGQGLHASNLIWTNRSAAIQKGKKGTVLRGKKSPRYGVKVSATTKRKMSLAKRGINHPSFKGYFFIEGVIYTSLTAVAKEFKTRISTVKERIQSEDWPQWIFVPKKNLI